MTNQEALKSCLERLHTGKGVFAQQQLRRVDLQAIPALLYLGIGHEGPVSHCFLPEVALHFQRGSEEALVLLCFSCNCILLLEESTVSVEKHSLGAGQELRQLLYALLGRLDLISKWAVPSSPLTKVNSFVGKLCLNQRFSFLLAWLSAYVVLVQRFCSGHQTTTIRSPTTY